MNLSITSAEYSLMMKDSKSLLIGDLSFKYSLQDRSVLGLSVSKHYGNAVARNLFKRRCRNIFRTTIINQGIDIFLVVRPIKQNVSFISMNSAFRGLYEIISS